MSRGEVIPEIKSFGGGWYSYTISVDSDGVQTLGNLAIADVKRIPSSFVVKDYNGKTLYNIHLNKNESFICQVIIPVGDGLLFQLSTEGDNDVNVTVIPIGVKYKIKMIKDLDDDEFDDFIEELKN